MEGHDNFYQNLLLGSQAGSSSAAAALRATMEAGDTSQAATASRVSAQRRGIEDLDLNSQAEGFPYLGSYQEILQPAGEEEALSVARGGRSRHFSFNAPRPVDGGSGSGLGGGRRGGWRGASVGGRRGAAQPTRGGRLAGGHSGGRLRQAHVDYEEEDVQESNLDKANWTEQNIDTFCQLWVHQMRPGNCIKGSMSARGYDALIKEFYKRMKLRHNRKCMSNRANACKRLWLFWLRLNKKTGGGVRPDGSIIVKDEAWWKAEIKANSEVRKFQYSVPTYIEYLAEMYNGLVVDGSTSCIPGQQEEREEDEEEREEEEEEDCHIVSPSSGGSRKRGASSISTATSPRKKSKSRLVNFFEGLISELKVEPFV